MNDAAKIIDRLTRTYPCPVCTSTVSLTVDLGSSTFYYACPGCGATWHQDGTPRNSTTVPTDDDGHPPR